MMYTYLRGEYRSNCSSLAVDELYQKRISQLCDLMRFSLFFYTRYRCIGTNFWVKTVTGFFVYFIHMRTVRNGHHAYESS